MRAIFVLLFAALFLTAPAAAQAPGMWEHNGSLMVVDRNGTSIDITYYDPRDGMRAEGVMPGQVLFNGSIKGGHVVGLARVFVLGCPPFAYEVSGYFEARGKSLTLYGLSPIPGPYCSITGWAETGNSFLRFTNIGFPRMR